MRKTNELDLHTSSWKLASMIRIYVITVAIPKRNDLRGERFLFLFYLGALFLAHGFKSFRLWQEKIMLLMWEWSRSTHGERQGWGTRFSLPERGSINSLLPVRPTFCFTPSPNSDVNSSVHQVACLSVKSEPWWFNHPSASWDSAFIGGTFWRCTWYPNSDRTYMDVTSIVILWTVYVLFYKCAIYHNDNIN